MVAVIATSAHGGGEAKGSTMARVLGRIIGGKKFIVGIQIFIPSVIVS